MPGDATDAEIRGLCEAQRWARAGTLWIEARGPEILTFLGAMRGVALDPEELFSEFCEDLWRSLPTFRWECSTKTWSYRLARHVWIRAKRRRDHKGAAVSLSAVPEIAKAAAAVRSSTALHLQTAVKDRFAALREELEPDDQMILVLRIDRNLEWHEVVAVMKAEGELEGDPDKAIPRLRKRFQRLKAKIRALAKDRGLIPPP